MECFETLQCSPSRSPSSQPDEHNINSCTNKPHADKLQAEKVRTVTSTHNTKTSNVDKSIQPDKLVHVGKLMLQLHLQTSKRSLAGKLLMYVLVLTVMLQRKLLKEKNSKYSKSKSVRVAKNSSSEPTKMKQV
ncbi:unnamed protein product [Lactuca saligna]|uniref:Uncharacterized protein n=1 Tax=Lactuca saligna TaxID=75948 RepID=A0AA35ZTR9_LACSI|nr:unnamed protein product [Lactuca saligna]